MINPIVPKTAVKDKAKKRAASVRFSLPQDVTSETVTFTGTGTDNNQRGVSVEGIVQYGHSSAASGTAPSIHRNNREGRVKRRQSSLDLRKDNVPDSLLLNDRNIIDDMAGSAHAQGKQGEMESISGENTQGCFRRFFLDPSYPLRRQMLLTFGSVSSLTILFVMIVSIVASIATGNAIKVESNSNVVQWVDDFMTTTSRFAAEALSPKVVPSDLVDLLVEVATDRFAGYPTTEDDSLTPFFDIQRKTNIYPLQNNPLPLDWDFRHTPNEGGNVNADNFADHVQNRWPWYSDYPRLSTKVAMYTMQGACDPRATDINATVYYPNCTKDNNNIETGGVVAPNPTNAQVHRKSADLSPFLKAVYEFHQDMKQIGYYFSNSGAGSSIFFPHYELDSSGPLYVSVGCEWMRTPNPIDSTLGPIGTDEEIARCHPADTEVPMREYNPLERGWCRDQALNPRRVHTIGPYIDAWSADKKWLMTTGRAVYDLVTGAFVSCIAADFTIDSIKKILEEVKVDELGILTLVRNDDNGTVVTSQNFDFDTADSPTSVDDPTLGTGVDRDMFDEIKSIVDFSRPWVAEDALSSYERSSFESEENIISAYPIPSIPHEYDPTYEPEFYIIFSVPKTNYIFQIADETSQKADESVRKLVVVTVMIGVIGLTIVIVLIFAAASFFVEPLKWMNEVGDQVVGKFGEELDAGIDYKKKISLPCSPKTELSSLLEEFTKMIARFSGEGTAKRMQINDTGKKVNVFDLSDEFAGLYKSREDSEFAFNYPKTSAVSDAAEGQLIDQCHLGPNTQTPPKTGSRSSALLTNVHIGKVYKSPLFLWMTALIVTPILLTTILISAVVLMEISNQLPSLTSPVEEEYILLRSHYHNTKTNLLANRASAFVERAARDTHLLTRFASWLYFDGMNMSGSFTELLQGGAEECKTASSDSECDYVKDLPCDCKWNDFYARGKNTCRAHPLGSRGLQKLHFEGLSEDVGPDGSRNVTSFPEVAYSPNTTAWWDNISALPQPTDDFASSNYGTTFARVKTFSALSTVIFPLYNYDKSNDKPIAMYVGFEADGMFAGYNGCSYGFTKYAFWKSSEANGAHKIRPELCPLGKYGYDARCREWYSEGKKKAISVNETVLHITAPYVFAGTPISAQSTSSPLIDPRNREHIGQVIIDFLPQSIFRLLESDNTKLADGSSAILVTPGNDALRHDTVVGPGFSLEDGASIEDLLLADDAFTNILQDMKAGKRGTGFFSSTDRGKLHITYAPVVVRSYRPLNSSDIANGVEQQHVTVFSLAFLDSDDAIAKSFKRINDFSSNTVIICIGVLSALVVVSTMLIIYIAFFLTTSMTEPILQLLHVIKGINRGSIPNDDVTNLTSYKGSCREVDSVYKTMEMLYKVVQFANNAFFSGDLEVANQVLKDALRLFTRLDNKKAMAVASNNLGNTMLTIYRIMKASNYEEMCGLSKREVLAKGSAYFAHSIKLGEVAYDEFYEKQGWSEECLVFMQFLANRYFNRAIFFLTTGCDDEELKSLGLRDLQITVDMDVEIVDQCLEMGFRINAVERYELMMSRATGLLTLVGLGYSPDELFIEDQINNAYQDLKNAMKNPSHELFKETNVVGRMQKLDTELIKYFSRAKNDNINAARVAIRMLIEDEYVFPGAEQEALRMLLTYMNTTEDENCPKDENGDIVKTLESAIETLEHEYARRAEHRATFNDSAGNAGMMKSLNVSIKASVEDISSRSVGKDEESIIEEIKYERRRTSVIRGRETFRGDVTMELF